MSLVWITLDELRANRRRARRLARRPGGVAVLDANGNPVFKLWIPSEALP